MTDQNDERTPLEIALNERGIFRNEKPSRLIQNRISGYVSHGFWKDFDGAEMCLAFGSGLFAMSNGRIGFGDVYAPTIAVVIAAIAVPKESRREGRASGAIKRLAGALAASGKPWQIMLEVHPLVGSGLNHVKREALERLYSGIGFTVSPKHDRLMIMRGE